MRGQDAAYPWGRLDEVCHGGAAGPSPRGGRMAKKTAKAGAKKKTAKKR
jgi:hypothetical protein